MRKREAGGTPLIAGPWDRAPVSTARTSRCLGRRMERGPFLRPIRAFPQGEAYFTTIEP